MPRVSFLPVRGADKAAHRLLAVAEVQKLIGDGKVCTVQITVHPGGSGGDGFHAILPVLADKAPVDWSKPLKSWSKDEMTTFLLMAHKLIGEAELARDQSTLPLRKSEDWDRTGDAIPF
jgi:hypothetical protein